MQRIGWRDRCRDRIADNLHIRNFLQPPSSSGRPLSHSQRFPASIRVEGRLTRSSVLSIHSSRVSCICPSSPVTYTYIYHSSLSLCALHSLIRLSTSTFALHPRFSFPQCTLILYSLRVTGRRTRRRVPQPLHFPSSIRKRKQQWDICAVMTYSPSARSR